LQTLERAVFPKGRIVKAVWETTGNSHVWVLSKAKWGL
jgi:hypothetical protein